MTSQLRISTGQFTDSGRKEINQDFHAVMIPGNPLLSSKGIAVALADGISSSKVSQIASETSVKGFLEDFYSTSESWTVKTSALRVLQATNSWLYSQTRNGPSRYDIDRGYVCTFSALVFKSNTAHLFHAGDSRIYRMGKKSMEQLTEDHRQKVSPEKSYLSRALGMQERLDIDYDSHPVETGDTYVLMTDGVYEFIDESFVVETINKQSVDLDIAARLIIDEAYRCGSTDNLTIQIVRVEQTPPHDIDELHQHSLALPFPPEIQPRMEFDGYEIIREIHRSSRSHIFLALDATSRNKVILKTPSIDLRNNHDYLQRFLMEEWIARRVDNIHLLKACDQTRKRNYIYTVTEYIDGKTLSQWMIDNPNPTIEIVRNFIEQISQGLRTMHRQEMLHQDLRPDNIMIDKHGTLKIIDFGSVRVAGIAEIGSIPAQDNILGTAQYTAPEYYLGEAGTTRSDMFSLGVIAYQMLSGRLPYGTNVAKASSRSAQHKLIYKSVIDAKSATPAWVDGAIRKMVNTNPNKRYDALSEFIYDLHHPNSEFVRNNQAPLLERNPLSFWKGLSLALFMIIIFLLSTHPSINS